MNLSYENIGAWSATFLADQIKEGEVVKVTEDATVGTCASGDAFCGVAGQVRGVYCAVQLSGLATVPFSGTAPSVGNAILTADGKGGVCTAAKGETYLVLAVQEADGTCVIKL